MLLISIICQFSSGCPKGSRWLVCALFCVFPCSFGWASAGDSGNTVSVVLRGSGSSAEQLLRAFTASELKTLKSGRLREKSPRSNQENHWRGPLLGEVVSESMKSLTSEERSLVDLVIVKGASGEQAWIPRAFLTKYPILLAEPSWDTVVPWSSRPKIRSEEVPHSTYWVQGVRKLELTSYRERFGRFYLKSRTDPVAVRGEKVFVQTCLACHHAQEPSISSRESSLSHPVVPAYREVDGRSLRALFRYWNAYQVEHRENR